MSKFRGFAFATALAAVFSFAALLTGAIGQQAPTPPPYSVLGGQASLAVTAASANVALPASSVPYGAVTIYNTGANDAFFALGGSSVAATTSSTIVKAGAALTIWANQGTYLAAITATSTTTIVLYQATGPIMQSAGGSSGGGGGGGGAITAAASAYASGSLSIGAGADGWDTTQGVTTDAAATAGGTGTVSAKLRRLSTQLPAAVGQTTMSASLPVTLSSDQSAILTAGFAAVSSTSITRSANTTTYTANTGWNNGTPTIFTFATACPAAAKLIMIPTISIYSSANPTTKLQGNLWLFKAIPGTIISDNATFNIAAADFANLTAGSQNGIPFTLASSQAAGAANSGTSITGQNLVASCASGVASLYGMVQVVNAYVPANAEVLTVALSTVGLN